MARDGKTNGTPAPEVIAQLAEDMLPTLIARLDRSPLGELEVRQDGWRIRLRRALTATDGVEAAPPAAPTRRPERRPERNPDGQSGQPARNAERGTLEIASPAVGYYLPREGLSVGASVRSGDVLGHIDVLGVRVEVIAPEDGRIAGTDAEAGEAVEYGQPLARLDQARR